MRAVREGGATLLPIDSEHSAIFQCLPEDRADLGASASTSIVLTASGGPFRTRAPATLRDVTPDEACAHPNWVMGRKISVDSATMMNKALEVIEARWLFGLAPEQIEVVIHPQSIIHSMVVVPRPVGAGAARHARHAGADRLRPGLARAHRIGRRSARLRARWRADLRGAGPAALSRPRRWPGTRCAAPPGTTAVLNAANEVAVAAFLDGAHPLRPIHAVNARTLEAVLPVRAAAIARGPAGARAARARGTRRRAYAWRLTA